MRAACYNQFEKAEVRNGRKTAEKPSRKQDRRYPELKTPGEKVQIDVKEVPYCCLKGAAKRDRKHLYQ